MRILVHGLVGDNLGGIETFLLNMNDFMSDDCIFDYIIEEEQCLHFNRIEKKGGKIYKVRSRKKHPIGNVIDILRLYIKYKDEYTTVYYNLSSLSWIFPQIIGRIMGFRVVIHSHNAMLIDANSNFLYRNMNRINKRILSHMNVIRLACSQNASEFMFGKKKGTIIYNGIDAEKYKFSKETRKRIREEYGIGEDVFVIGTVGRLTYEKNPLFTLKVFSDIQKEKRESVLLMCGEGNLRKKLKEKAEELNISEKVIMTGNIDNINEVLNAMDVFLQPSQHEGLGIALIEAQANGLPCFTSKNVVPAEAKVTDLIVFIPLDRGIQYWCNTVLDRAVMIKNDRESYSSLVSHSNYNIRDDASNLQRILTGALGDGSKRNYDKVV